MSAESKGPSTCQNRPISKIIGAWYAIRVRSRFEQAVSGALSGKGYEAYLPLYKVRREWSDRLKAVDSPLFPGYLFCRLDVQVRLPILTTPGVISIVGTGKTPVPISEREIDAIQTMVRSGLLLQPWPNLAAGSRIVIEKGPLQGLEGVALNIKNKYHLFVSVPLLQRSVSVEIDREWIRPLATVTNSSESSIARLANNASL
jgi:transcription antitermination factor NusG